MTIALFFVQFKQKNLHLISKLTRANDFSFFLLITKKQPDYLKLNRICIDDDDDDGNVIEFLVHPKCEFFRLWHSLPCELNVQIRRQRNRSGE